VVTDQVISVLSLVKDACALTQFPGVSQACALGGTKYNQAKALLKLMPPGTSATAPVATFAVRSQRLLPAMESAAPLVRGVAQRFAGPVTNLKGKGITQLTEFGPEMIRVGEGYAAMLPDLYNLAKNLREAAGLQMFALTGTDAEKVFKCIRDISAVYSMAVSFQTLAIPGYETTSIGQAAVASSDILGVVAAYLYTMPGQ
jgi:hypothetical protein